MFAFSSKPAASGAAAWKVGMWEIRSVAECLLLNSPKYSRGSHACSKLCMFAVGTRMLRWGEGNREELCKNGEEEKCFAEVAVVFHAHSRGMFLGCCDIMD